MYTYNYNAINLDKKLYISYRLLHERITYSPNKSILLSEKKYRVYVYKQNKWSKQPGY